MIPKIINYIWIGDQAKKPVQHINRCKELMPEPEWTYVEWTDFPAEVKDLPFTQQALTAQKISFAIDPLKAFILTKGGFYIDTDVIVNIPFTRYLDYNVIVAPEMLNFKCFLGTGFIGAKPNHELFQRYFAEFQRLDFAPHIFSPTIFTRVFLRLYPVLISPKAQILEGGIKIEDIAVGTLDMLDGQNVCEHLFYNGDTKPGKFYTEIRRYYQMWRFVHEN